MIKNYGEISWHLVFPQSKWTMQEITTKLCIIIGQFGVFWFEFVSLAFLKTKCIKQCQPQHWIFKDYFLNKSYLVFLFMRHRRRKKEGRVGRREIKRCFHPLIHSSKRPQCSPPGQASQEPRCNLGTPVWWWQRFSLLRQLCSLEHVSRKLGIGAELGPKARHPGVGWG